MIHSIKLNWKVYCMEAICLGLFMVSACLFGTLLWYPPSPIHITDSFMRDCVMGVAMGLSAILIIYSPMGKLSGAHMNPAFTVAFWSLGKIKIWDALYYSIFQCAGGILAVYGMHFLLGAWLEDPHVNYVITAPGKFGVSGAFVTEIVIAFVMMLMVLLTTNTQRFASYTGVFAGVLVMIYVILSGPISGFGMNPARSLASAIPSGMYPAFWIYLTAPFIGMFMAVGMFRFAKGRAMCAKLHHSHLYQCIFNCGYCTHEEE